MRVRLDSFLLQVANESMAEARRDQVRQEEHVGEDACKEHEKEHNN